MSDLDERDLSQLSYLAASLEVDARDYKALIDIVRKVTSDREPLLTVLNRIAADLEETQNIAEVANGLADLPDPNLRRAGQTLRSATSKP